MTVPVGLESDVTIIASIPDTDAIKSADRPLVEVHLSNIFARESFRHHSFVSMAALGVICGFGVKGYTMAIDALVEHLESKAA